LARGALKVLPDLQALSVKSARRAIPATVSLVLPASKVLPGRLAIKVWSGRQDRKALA
jgi:hypothetical protein